MSLQVWLPLNGNTNNNGVSTCTISGSPNSWGAGKLGKCATFTDSSLIITNTPLSTSTKNYSFAFWLTDTSPTTTQCIYNGRTTTGGALAIFIYQGSFRFDDGEQHLLSYSVPTDKWEHYCFTRDSSHIKFYVNGVLTETIDSVDFTCTATYASIGRSSVNTTSTAQNSLVGSLNDYRIYDHCLSPKEVKEISKGLVLHYPLNQPERNVNYFTNGAIEYTGSFPSSSYTDYISRDGFAVNPNEVWTLSYDAKGSADDLPLVNHFFNNSSGIVQVSSCLNSQGRTKTGVDGYTILYLTTEYQHYWVTWTFDSGTAASKKLLFRLNSTANSGKTITVKNVKLEKSSFETTYSESPSWNDNTEYDTSGCKNNGTVSGTISLSKDSPRYEYCYLFGSDGYITAGQASGKMPTEAITVVCWAYLDDWNITNVMQLISCTEGGGWQLSINDRTGCIETELYKSGVGYETITYDLTNISAGWHHCAFTFNGTLLAMYLDAVQVASSTVDENVISYNSTAPLLISGEPNSSAYTGQSFQGKLSDVRIYATALSADDIKELYTTPVSITSNGRIITQGEVIEE